MPDRLAQNRPLLIFLGLMAASLVALWLVPPIPQDQAYHQFADDRTLFGIPNFWNVVSNLPFALVGAVGLWQFHRDPATVVFFAGVFLTAFGSAYYHWAPSDGTLFWDRLPMAIAFSGVLAAAVEERIDARTGRLLLWPLVVLGVISMLVWRSTGDLRLYGWVQFFPILALPVMFLLLKPKYTGTMYWIVAAGWYLLAKILEYTDAAIYSAGHLLTGHTLKHLAAAAATYAILRYYQTRRPIG
jgi:hypothetical protein